MSPELVFIIPSLLLSLLFFLYGFNHYYLLYLARNYKIPEIGNSGGQIPEVSMHLPVYNERYVIRRLVEACARSVDQFGRDHAEILILDDSDDETVADVDSVVAEYLVKGYRIAVMRREDRQGFKAGALQAALERSEADFIAVFDADFIPHADFLVRSLPYFTQDENLGAIQSRWTHLNRDYNYLTKAISIGIDVHFLIEQAGRYAAGFFQNFNGSGGILRRKAMLEAGGWQADTLAEDLDISYRIQLQDYHILYLNELQSPAEIPPTVPSYKKQQGRWANGSLRTAKKLLPALLTDRGLGVKKRLQALIHLTGYMVHPLMFFSFLLTVVGTLLGLYSIRLPQFDRLFNNIEMTGSMGVGSASMIFLFNLTWVGFGLLILLCAVATWITPVLSIRQQDLPLSKYLPSLIVLFLLGFGTSFSNTLEAGKALFTNRHWAFKRTPKYAVEHIGQEWQSKKYQVPIDFVAYMELMLVCLGCVAIAYAVWHSSFGVLIILVPFTAAYAFVSLLTIRQSRQERAV